MNDMRIFIDFGSTFTKMTALDLAGEEILARIQVPSTANTDITHGLDDAFAAMSRKVKIGCAEKKRALACSSAAGGLRMVCVGLVPEYTTLAGRMAALGAGAKIVGEYSYELTESEVEETEHIAPDIVLLAGGTDGGNKKVIVHNAQKLAAAGPGVGNILVAGNKSIYDELKRIFAGSGKNVAYTGNVMPEIGVIDVASANEKIREIFIDHIVAAKGMNKVRTIIGDVIMPTPSAVLAAAQILADGTASSGGMGELVLVDVGGATTDVYSVAHGASGKSAGNIAGLPEPYVKRTVEGDLGLVYNLDVLGELAKNEIVPEPFSHAVNSLRTGKLPTEERDAEIHLILSRVAVKTAMERHAGMLKTISTIHGDIFVQKGKDLTGIKNVIGSGGAISFSRDPLFVLKGVMYQEANPGSLKPKNPRMMLDKHNILYAIGLLAQSDPEKALRIGQKYLAEL